MEGIDEFNPVELFVLAAIAIPLSTLVMQSLSSESDDEFDLL